MSVASERAVLSSARIGGPEALASGVEFQTSSTAATRPQSGLLVATPPRLAREEANCLEARANILR